MEYKRIELDRILQEGADAELYVFTCRPDLTELTTSINRAGLLVAPVLQEDERGICRIVCGWSRIRVLRRCLCRLRQGNDRCRLSFTKHPGEPVASGIQ